MEDPIIVWKYEWTPLSLRVSDNGGDEDWLAEIPPGYDIAAIKWMRLGGGFALRRSKTYEHPLKDGWKIVIGSHC